jgi:uncharacterized membrane protein (UPF0127 family)
MPIHHKIASALFTKYPDVLNRSAASLPLTVGDRVIDAGYISAPVHVPDGHGVIVKMHKRIASVRWDDGSETDTDIDNIRRVKAKYVQQPHDTAYSIPRFSANDRVILGNGEHGKILEEVTGPTGFKSFRVEILQSKGSNRPGLRVFATQNGMVKAASISQSDVVVSVRDESGQTMGVVACDLAVSDREQSVGLQKYSSLPTDRGMLFPYDPPRKVQFHMANVQFPIDILFVNGQGVISDIEHWVDPGSTQKYASSSRSAAVLEVVAGWTKARNIAPGYTVSIKTIKNAAETYSPADQNQNFDPSNHDLGGGMNTGVPGSPGKDIMSPDATDSSSGIGFDPSSTPSSVVTNK